MSRATSTLSTIQPPTASPQPSQNQIFLLDHSSSQAQASSTEPAGEQQRDAERNHSEALSPSTSSADPLFKKITSNSIQDTVRQQYSKQKYARYQSDRYEDHAQETSSTAAQQGGEPSTAAQKSYNYLERGRGQVRNLLKGKKDFGRASEKDVIFDILYENQRGSFLFGSPRFSSNSLLNFDPNPWQNAAFRTSAVDIRNAQVPDPSWEWAWKSWYVDMSRDVDEEGWEYSLAFPNQFAWHGNHPWFHSFVRRRRWLRKRVRKDALHKTKNKSHELAPDYFTIHTKLLSASSQDDARKTTRAPVEDEIGELDIPDMGSLMAVLRKSKIDREKLGAIRRFANQGGGDLYYLSNRMPEIMSLFIYQSSRRQVLAELMHHHGDATERRDSLAGHSHDDDEARAFHDAASQQAEHLLSAIKAADEQVQKLEYWSDIRDMAQHGETLLGKSSGDWDAKRWQGLDTDQHGAFKSKQQADDPAAELHDEPETQDKRTKESSSGTDSSGYTTAPSLAPSVATRASRKQKDDDTDLDLERYTTASETPNEGKDKQWRRAKGKNRALNLDGVQEEDEGAGRPDDRGDVKAEDEEDVKAEDGGDVTAKDEGYAQAEVEEEAQAEEKAEANCEEANDEEVIQDYVPPRQQAGVDVVAPESIDAEGARAALNYKRIPYKTEWIEYPDIAPRFKSFGIPPNPDGSLPEYTIPAARLPDGRYVMDSRKIADELEALQPERPLHLANGYVERTQELVTGTRGALGPVLIPRVPEVLLKEASAAYFHETRAKRFGMTLPELAESDKAGEAAWSEAEPHLVGLKELLHENGGGPFVAGKEVSYADLILGSFWAFERRLGEDVHGRLMNYDETFPKHWDAVKAHFERDDR